MCSILSHATNSSVGHLQCTHKGKPREKLQNPSWSPDQRWKAVKTPNPQSHIAAGEHPALSLPLCRPCVPSTSRSVSHLSPGLSLGLLMAWPGWQQCGHCGGVSPTLQRLRLT